MNNALKLALDKGATMKMVAEDWEFLQVSLLALYICTRICMYVCFFLIIQIQVALLINGDTPGIPRQMLGNKAVRGE